MVGQIKFEIVPSPHHNSYYLDYSGSPNGTMISTDINGDGEIDIFFGGLGVSSSFAQFHIKDSLQFEKVFPQFLPEKVGKSVFLDADLDGDQDLLATGMQKDWINQTKYQSKLYLNDGNGVFKEDTSNSFEGLYECSIVTEDFNGDGVVDIFLQGWEENKWVYSNLYLNDGKGKFLLKKNDGIRPLRNGDAEAADVDGDGDHDLILSGFRNQVVRDFVVMLNDGTGSFTLDTLNNFPDDPVELEVGDLDGDGDPDLMTTAPLSSIISAKLYINNGAGKFNKVNNGGILGLLDAVGKFEDIDNDNDLDIIISGRDKSTTTPRNKVKVYRNNGNAKFNAISNRIVPVQFGLINTFDIDGDQDPDLLLYGWEDGNKYSYSRAKVYINNGNGKFAGISDPNHLNNGVRDADHEFGDLNGDGFLDLVLSGNVYNKSTGFICDIYLNDTTGRFLKSFSSTITSHDDGNRIELLDADGDGDFDLLHSGQERNDFYLRLYKNNGKGTFRLHSDIDSGNSEYGFLAAADIDGDTDQDFVLTGGVFRFRGNNVSKIYENDGSGNFTVKDSTTLPQVENGSCFFNDVDNDNDPDLLISGTYGTNRKHTVRLYLNDGSGNFTEDQRNNFLKLNRVAADFSDIDNDGDDDLVIGGGISHGSAPQTKAAIYKNDGTGLFTMDSTQNIFPIQGGNNQFIDVDNDGDSDLFVSGMRGWTPANRIYRNDGSGNFSLLVDKCLINTEKSSCGLADFDNDGDPDLLLNGEAGGRKLLGKIYHNKPCALDTSVSRLDSVTLKSMHQGVNFQWIRCDSVPVKISGENHPTFTAIDSGSYAVVVYDGCCSDTSNCYVIDVESSGLNSEYEKYSSHGDLELYPNPTRDAFYIKLPHQDYATAQIQIYNALGRLVFQRSELTTAEQEIQLEGRRGFFIVKVNYADGSSESRKLLLR